MTTQSPSDPLTSQALSRRERLILTCDYNAGYIQAQIESLLDQMGWAAASGFLMLVKKMTSGEIKRTNLHELPRWLLLHMDDATFDRYHAGLMQWLGEL